MRVARPFLAFVVLVILGWSSRASAAPVQWTVPSGGNGNWYDITESPGSWQDAENEAVAKGGHLVSIGDTAENAFLVSSVLTGAFASVPLWIGLSDSDQEGTLTWSNGDSLVYSNWNVGEPDSLMFPGEIKSETEDFVAINWHVATGDIDNDAVPGDWNDAPLGGTTGYGGNSDGPYFGIIETVPEPSTALLLGLGLLGLGMRRRS